MYCCKKDAEFNFGPHEPPFLSIMWHCPFRCINMMTDKYKYDKDQIRKNLIVHTVDLQQGKCNRVH